jgi:hypothetical protein
MIDTKSIGRLPAEYLFCGDYFEKKHEPRRPSKTEIRRIYPENGLSQTSIHFGVSVYTIKKWLKYYSISIKELSTKNKVK